MDDGERRTLAVVGGGIAGLAAAWEAATSPGDGSRVIVFEGAGRFGGKVLTEPFGGRPVDLGPDAFVARRPEALSLCAELGLGPELVAPGTRRAYVWARGRLRPLPDGLALGVPTRLWPLARSGICSPAGLVGPALDLLRPAWGSAGTGRAGTDGAVGEIVRRRLGAQVTARLAGPLIGGIHAGSVDDMSTAAVFPALLQADGRGGSLMRALRRTLPGPAAAPAASGATTGAGTDGAAPVFLAPRGGMGRLVDTLTGALEKRGVELWDGHPVEGLRRVPGAGAGRWALRSGGGEVEADAVVLAVPATVAAPLVRAEAQDLAQALDRVTYSSVALVTLRFPDDASARVLDGSGFLVPRAAGGVEGGPLLTACTWLTSKWPELGRGGDVLVRASVGRQGDRRHEGMDDAELVERCTVELTAMMGLRRPPVEAVVTRWPEAFPQYAVGHLDLVGTIEAAAGALPALAVAGAALHGVGIPACIGSGRRAARAVLDS